MSDERVSAVHQSLLSSGLIAPVDVGGAEERAWLDCDLASLAENRLGEVNDPFDIDQPRREHWLARATLERPSSLSQRGQYERSYWLLDQGVRIGTVALTTGSQGNNSVYLSSFYVRPPYRGKGMGRQALGTIQDALAENRLFLRLETSWCWPRTVRFYLSSGLWIYMWKRDLMFFYNPKMPAPVIDVGQDVATLSVPHGADNLVLARASRNGSTLDFDERPFTTSLEDQLGGAPYYASSTLSLALALQAWPLIRSAQHWEDRRYGDAGPPEALAYKIQIWEAYARHHGFRVDTPRIPNLEYPSWQELKAKWNAAG